ncbi:peptidase MA family metallohydrolase [Gordonia jacobaea]|uniref:peptidase MA family metallohydrolase n=1 Tax=Gordonia jacobaea TaxID=122202 RepID=UPI003D720481
MHAEASAARVACVLLAAATLAVGASACSSDDQPRQATSSSVTTTTTNPNVYLQERSEGVAQLLDDLTRAVTDGDRARLDSLLDASTPPTFRDSLTVAAQNLSGRDFSGTGTSTASSAAASPPSANSPSPFSQSPSSPTTAVPARGTTLKLKEFGYQLASTQGAETQVPAEVAARLESQGSTDSWVAPVQLRYALGGANTPGVDEPTVTLDRELVVARYGDGWKLVGDATLLGDDAPATQLWDLPGLEATDVLTGGGPSTVVSYPGTDVIVDRTRSSLRQAVSAVTAFWGSEWPRRAVVVATATPDEFSAIAHSSATDTSAAAAATVFDRVEGDTVIGQRVVLAPSANDLPAPALAVVLRHELTHVAARSVTAKDAPLWITEGVAEYVGRKGTYVRLDDAAPDLAAQVRAGQSPDALPSDQDFGVATDKSALAYQSAWALAAYVADRYGETRLKALYRGVAASGDVGRQDNAIATALGVDRNRLIADWRRWLAEQVPG